MGESTYPVCSVSILSDLLGGGIKPEFPPLALDCRLNDPAGLAVPPRAGLDGPVLSDVLRRLPAWPSMKLLET